MSLSLSATLAVLAATFCTLRLFFGRYSGGSGHVARYGGRPSGVKHTAEDRRKAYEDAVQAADRAYDAARSAAWLRYGNRVATRAESDARYYALAKSAQVHASAIAAAKVRLASSTSPGGIRQWEKFRSLRRQAIAAGIVIAAIGVIAITLAG